MWRRLGRRASILPLCSIALVVGLTLSAAPRTADAAPDPVIASVLSASATAVPLALAAVLLGTGRGAEEGIRFDAGMVTLGLGSILGPSVGQMYARGGVDAFVTWLLRAVTGAVMLTGVGFRLRGPTNRKILGTSLAITGAVPTGLLAIYDIYAASVSATEARYNRSDAQMSVPRELVSVALCGPIPCATEVMDDAMTAATLTYRR